MAEDKNIDKITSQLKFSEKQCRRRNILIPLIRKSTSLHTNKMLRESTTSQHTNIPKLPKNYMRACDCSQGCKMRSNDRYQGQIYNHKPYVTENTGSVPRMRCKRHKSEIGIGSLNDEVSLSCNNTIGSHTELSKYRREKSRNKVGQQLKTMKCFCPDQSRPPLIESYCALQQNIQPSKQIDRRSKSVVVLKENNRRKKLHSRTLSKAPSRALLEIPYYSTSSETAITRKRTLRKFLLPNIKKLSSKCGTILEQSMSHRAIFRNIPDVNVATIKNKDIVTKTVVKENLNNRISSIRLRDNTPQYIRIPLIRFSECNNANELCAKNPRRPKTKTIQIMTKNKPGITDKVPKCVPKKESTANNHTSKSSVFDSMKKMFYRHKYPHNNRTETKICSPVRKNENKVSLYPNDESFLTRTNINSFHDVNQNYFQKNIKKDLLNNTFYRNIHDPYCDRAIDPHLSNNNKNTNCYKQNEIDCMGLEYTQNKAMHPVKEKKCFIRKVQHSSDIQSTIKDIKYVKTKKCSDLRMGRSRHKSYNHSSENYDIRSKTKKTPKINKKSLTKLDVMYLSSEYGRTFVKDVKGSHKKIPIVKNKKIQIKPNNTSPELISLYEKQYDEKKYVPNIYGNKNKSIGCNYIECYDTLKTAYPYVDSYTHKKLECKLSHNVIKHDKFHSIERKIRPDTDVSFKNIPCLCYLKKFMCNLHNNTQLKKRLKELKSNPTGNCSQFRTMEFISDGDLVKECMIETNLRPARFENCKHMSSGCCHYPQSTMGFTNSKFPYCTYPTYKQKVSSGKSIKNSYVQTYYDDVSRLYQECPYYKCPYKKYSVISCPINKCYREKCLQMVRNSCGNVPLERCPYENCPYNSGIHNECLGGSICGDGVELIKHSYCKNPVMKYAKDICKMNCLNVDTKCAQRCQEILTDCVPAPKFACLDMHGIYNCCQNCAQPIEQCVCRQNHNDTIHCITLCCKWFKIIICFILHFIAIIYWFPFIVLYSIIKKFLCIFSRSCCY